MWVLHSIAESAQNSTRVNIKQTAACNRHQQVFQLCSIPPTAEIRRKRVWSCYKTGVWALWRTRIIDLEKHRFVRPRIQVIPASVYLKWIQAILKSLLRMLTLNSLNSLDSADPSLAKNTFNFLKTFETNFQTKFFITNVQCSQMPRHNI